MVTSVLDDVPGLGPARRARLLREFGSVKRLRAQSLETLTGLGWLPDAVGRSVHAALHGAPDAPASGAADSAPDLPSLEP